MKVVAEPLRTKLRGEVRVCIQIDVRSFDQCSDELLNSPHLAFGEMTQLFLKFSINGHVAISPRFTAATALSRY